MGTHLCFPSSTTLWSPPPLLLLLLATPVLATMALATTTARGRLRLTPLSFLELSPTLLPLCSLLSMPSLPLVLWLTPLLSRLSLRLLLRSPMRSLPTTFPLLSATAATPTTDKLLTLDGVRRSLNQTCHRFILPRNPDLVLYCSYYYHCCCCCLFSANFYEIV